MMMMKDNFLLPGDGEDCHRKKMESLSEIWNNQNLKRNQDLDLLRLGFFQPMVVPILRHPIISCHMFSGPKRYHKRSH